MRHSTLSFFIFFLFSSSCFAEAFTIEAYDITIQVRKDGSMRINETIDVEFTEDRRGIFRSIPIYYNLNGQKKKLKIDDISVKGWNHKFYKENGNYNIRFGDADKYLTGSQQYVFSYTVNGGILKLDTHDEIYWDLIGNDWDTEIRNFTYELVFPREEEINFTDYKIYSGRYGSTSSSVSIEKEYHSLKGRSSQVLRPNESVSIAVRLPSGFFEIDVPKVKEGVGFSNDKSYPLPIALILGMIAWWRSKGRNRKVAASTTLELYPPQDHNPAEIGLLIDNRAQDRDLLSLIPYWGNKKYLKVNSVNEYENDLVLEKLSDLPSNSNDYETELFNAIFKNSNYVPMETLKQKIYSSLNKSKNLLKKGIYKTNYYDQNTQNIFQGTPMTLIAILSAMAAVFSFAVMHAIPTGILFIALTIIALVLRFATPKKSEEGNLLESNIKSFKRFLKEDNVEETEELLKKDPNYFEKMYPYAIALELSDSLMDKFDRHEIDPPGWYYTDRSYGSPRETISDFSKSYNTETIRSAFTSVPPSSSGSSGGGGGFSGGGSGGGGGGSW